jgi:DNA repair exonuclease SbcCD ATPase subunit
MSEDRLNRIEQKLDKLVDIVESIARVEEKIASNDSKMERFEYRLDKMEEEVDDVGKIARQNSGVAKFADKFFWLLIGGLISFGVWLARVGVSG